MRIKAFIGTIGVSVLLTAGLVFPAVAQAQTPGQITRRSAMAEVQPSLSADHQTINVLVKYRAEELSWTVKGQTTVIYPQKISAIELYLNGAERQTKLFTPSAQGERQFKISLSSLSPTEQASPLRFQAKISTHFVYAPLHIDSSSWNKRTAVSEVVVFDSSAV